MAASTITRTTWTNDTGTPTVPVGDGTIINNARLQDIYAAIDQMFSGAGAYTSLTVGGVLVSEGFGTNAFSAGGTGTQRLQVRNTTSGTANRASVDLGNNSTAELCRVIALSSAHTASGYLQPSGGVIEANGAGGLSMACTEATGVMRFYTGASVTERMRILADGKINIGHTTAGNDFDVRSSVDGVAGLGGIRIRRDDGSYLIVNMDDGGASAFGSIQPGDGSAFRPLRLAPSSQCHFADGSVASPSLSFVNDTDTGFCRSGADAVGLVAAGAAVMTASRGGANVVTVLGGSFGTVQEGARLNVQANTSGGGAPGMLVLSDKGAAIRPLWVDSSGNVRVHTSAPNESTGDTIGTVVGTQTSTRATKRLIRKVRDTASSLALIAETPLYRFNYRTQDRDTRFLGIMADESPEFVMHGGQSFNPVNAFGHTAAAIKALLARVETLEAALAARG